MNKELPVAIGVGVQEGRVAIAFQQPTTMFMFGSPDDAIGFAVQLIERAISLGADLPPTLTLHMVPAPPSRAH